MTIITRVTIRTENESVSIGYLHNISEIKTKWTDERSEDIWYIPQFPSDSISPMSPLMTSISFSLFFGHYQKIVMQFIHSYKKKKIRKINISSKNVIVDFSRSATMQ
jgi:hypothetical protein